MNANLSAGQKKAADIVRLIVLLPVAISGGILSHYFVIMLNLIATKLNVYPESFVGDLISRCIGNMTLGSVSVIIAFMITPYYKKNVAIFMALFLLVTSLFFLFVTIFTADYRGMLAIFSISFGAIPTAYYIFVKERRISRLRSYMGK